MEQTESWGWRNRFESKYMRFHFKSDIPNKRMIWEKIKKMEIGQQKKYHFQESEEKKEQLNLENNIRIHSKVGTNHTQKFMYVYKLSISEL